MNLDTIIAIVRIAIGVINKYGTIKYALVPNDDLINLQATVAKLEKDTGIS